MNGKNSATEIKNYSVSPSPFPMEFGIRIWDLDLELDLGLTTRARNNVFVVSNHEEASVNAC